jgi:hypothetical protein
MSRAITGRSGVAGRLGRRALVTGVCALATSWALPAWAGTYLDRAKILITTANEELDYLKYRLGNEELSRMLHRIALARLEAARTMKVPKEVAQAHPHLLLMLENIERAIDAALSKEAQRFMVYRRQARDEEQVFRGILEQLGFPLPETR